MKAKSELYTLLAGIIWVYVGYHLSITGKIESFKYGTLNYGEESFIVGVMFILLGLYMFILSAINIYKRRNK